MIWKPITNFDYEISNTGCVRNAKTKRCLRLSLDPWGYCKVHLKKNNKTHVKCVHRLVAEAFIPKKQIKRYILQVNHIDGNKQNNHISNLEWCTNHENQRHAVKTGLKKQSNGFAKPFICVETNVVYKSLRHAKTELAISVSAIHLCLKGKTKTAGGFHWIYVS